MPGVALRSRAMTWSIDRKNVLITGGSSGLGLATAVALVPLGAQVTITSRDAGRAEKAVRFIEKVTGTRVEADIVDLSSFDSIHAFASSYCDRHPNIDVLFNNAGGVFGSRRETPQGHEATFGGNHLGPFLLTSLLDETIGVDRPGRIINTSSVAHTYAEEGILFDDLEWKHRRYKMMDAYGHSKLANILHARGINDRAEGRIQAVAVHPGIVATSFGGRGGSLVVRAGTKFGKPWMRNVEEGADTMVWLATVPDLDCSNGIYFSDRAAEASTRWAKDQDQADRLWAVSEELVGLA